MISAEYQFQNFADFSFSAPATDAEGTVVLVPGVAANRFGNQSQNGPTKAIREALFDVVSDTHNVIFADINAIGDVGPGAQVDALTPQAQSDRLQKIVDAAGDHVDTGQLVFVSHSMGALILAELAHDKAPIADAAQAVLWGPPASEGRKHRDGVVGMFAEKPGTAVGGEGAGVLETSSGRLIRVTPAYWASVDDSSLREHHDAMTDTYADVTAFYATHDWLYPGSADYLRTHAPGFAAIGIDGPNHSFSAEPIKQQLGQEMKRIFGLV